MCDKDIGGEGIKMFEDERGRKEETEEKWEGRNIKPQQPSCMRASALLPSSTGSHASLPLATMTSRLPFTRGEAPCVTGKELQWSLVRCLAPGETYVHLSR